MVECGLDTWSLQEITAVLKELGYTGNVKVFYVRPEYPLEDAPIEIKGDKECINMGQSAMSHRCRNVQAYVSHACKIGEGIVLTFGEEPQILQSEGDGYDGGGEENVDDVHFDDSEEDDSDDGFAEHIGLEVEEVMNEDLIGQEALHTDEGSQMVLFPHDDIGGSTEFDGAILEDNELESESDYETDCLYNDDAQSNDEPKRKRYVKYDHNEMCPTFKFQLGMDFNSIAEFRSAVREYALLNGFGLYFVKTDKVRCRARCSGCKWEIFVSKVGGSHSFRVKTLKPKHTCCLTFNSTMASSKWVAEKVVDSMRTNPNIKLSEVIEEVRKNYMADVLVTMAYWGRKKAKEKLHGSYAEQYNKLWDYCAEVRRTNPGSTLQIKAQRMNMDDPPIFKRMYMCLEPVKRAFLTCCRPLIGVDGCF